MPIYILIDSIVQITIFYVKINIIVFKMQLSCAI